MDLTTDVEEANKKLDLTEVRVTLDAAAEQENEDCRDEDEELHPDYIHLDVDIVQENEEVKQVPNIYRKIDLPEISILKDKQGN